MVALMIFPAKLDTELSFDASRIFRIFGAELFYKISVKKISE